VKAQNVNAEFIVVYQTTDSEKNLVISPFIQMMWIFQPQHRILLHNLIVSLSQNSVLLWDLTVHQCISKKFARKRYGTIKVSFTLTIFVERDMSAKMMMCYR